MHTERGEGKLSSFIWLLVIAAMIYAAWHVAPAYIANYALKDKMNEIARSPRGMTTDERVADMLWKYVREERLESYIPRNCFRISTVETSRQISCEYEREVDVLPGWKHKLRFTNTVSQPLIF